MHRKWIWIIPVAVLAMAIGCGDGGRTSSSPTAPSTGATVGTGAAADTVTLKATAPALTYPVGGVRIDTRKPRFTWNAAAGKFVQAAFTYRIQVTDDAGNLLEEDSVGLFYNLKNDLATDKLFRWRVRAEYEGAFGPWTSWETFLSPEQPEGYIRATEIYDPLWNGKTVGEVIGPVEWVPNQGVRLLTHESRITYNLPQTLEQGEFSIMVTGMDEGSPGDKSKVMSMQENGGDITTNDYRFTVEKRGRDYSIPGAVTYRVITGDAGEEEQIHDGTRIAVAFSDENWYFWRATWTLTGARVEVLEGGITGPTLYSRGVGYSHPYRPTPHVVHLGAPVGRAGPLDATVPGMIIKNVWVSPNPRPSWVDATSK